MTKSNSYPGRKGRRGTSIVEFALVLPLFIALVLFLIDILRFYFIQQTLSFQVREGLRAGVVYDPSDPPVVNSVTLSRRDVIEQAINDSNLYGFRIYFTGGGSVSNADVVATLTPSDGGVANTAVTLQMAYQNFTFLTPFLGVLFAAQPTGSIPLSVSQSFQNEAISE